MGIGKRFSPEVALLFSSFKQHFLGVIEPIFSRSKSIVDVGCGTGMYFPLVSPLCKSLTGIELSEGCARLAHDTIQKYKLSNLSISVQDSTALGFDDNTFDMSLCVDSLHHVENLDQTLRELVRIVKPQGDIVIFEPNLTNPLLLAMCLVDRNEWGAVSRCYLRRYQRLFARHFDQVTGEYNGLLIGPQGKVATSLADFMVSKWASPVFARFSAKMFFHLKNNKRS